MSVTRFQVLCVAARNRDSATRVIALGKFIAENPKYAQEGAPVLYEHLHPQFLPEDDDFLANWLSVSLAASALCCLTNQSFCENPDYLAMMVEWWPNICKWLDVLAAVSIRAEFPSWGDCRPYFLRLLNQTINLAMYHRDALRSPETCNSTFMLWINMHRNTSFRAVMSNHLPLRQIVEITIHDAVVEFLEDNLVDQTNESEMARKARQIIEADPVRVAETATDHLLFYLRKDSQNKDVKAKATRQMVSLTLNTIHSMAEVTPFAKALPYIRLIPAIIALLEAQSKEPFTLASALDQLGEVKVYIDVFLSAFQNAASHLWLICALQLQVLQIMLNLRDWLSWGSEQSDLEGIKVAAWFIGRAICPSLVYPSVIRAAAKALHHVQQTDGYAVKYKQMGLVTAIWEIMEKTILERADMLSQAVSSCGRVDCSSTSTSRFYIYNGCNGVEYCSRACQKQDWKHGTHRSDCMSIQKLDRESGRTRPHMSPKERGLMSLILDDILNGSHEQMHDILRNLTDRKDRFDITITIDFVVYPPQIAIYTYDNISAEKSYARLVDLPGTGDIFVMFILPAGSEPRKDGMYVKRREEWEWDI